MNNYMKLEISAIGANESFARSTVAAFALSLDPSLSELSDIKTAVSEAVTNCIVHAYGRKKDNSADAPILIECETIPSLDGDGGVLHISVTDRGCGIDDVDKAMQPFYTTLKDDERSGMGFTVMQAFMSELIVTSEKGKGTSVRMTKKIGMKDGCDA
jgi:stage II sporulation protein AB (anti-sigma F factor)